MGDMALQTLEAAAQILMAPPNIVSSEQRHQAESVFLQFRGTANPYHLCREILETSNCEYVLFEAASLLKTALIKEWSSLSEDDLTSLRQYLLNYLLNKDTPSFLREKIMQTIAIIVKRGSIDDSGRGRKALLSELEQIILDSPLKQQKLACSLTLAIMQEYAITVKSADVGLIWEVHYRLKKSFELLELKRIFRFTVGILEQFTRSGHDIEQDQAVLLKQLLTIVETILCWGQVTPLLTKRFIGAIEAIYESDKAPALRLPALWKDTILEPQLTNLFFDMHMKVRMNPELSNHSLTCLEQLASLSGVVVSENVIKQKYLDNYVNIFLNTVSQMQPTAREMLGIADIYRRLIQFFLPSMIATLPTAFLDTLTRLTTHCIRGSIVEESVNDDTMWREALNKFLHTWSCFTQDNESFSNERLQGPCIEIFNTYLQCRLAPPDGTRGTDHRDIADDIKDDVEEDERELHNYVLAILGCLARKAPGHCCHVLNTLLQSRTQKLEEQLQLMHMGEIPAVSSEHLTTLYEDLHWILMIIGHFIALDCTEGETVMIPTEITQFCVAENANIEQCLKYLSGEVTSDENVDPVVRLVGSVIRLSSCEVAALEAGLGPALSPEMSASTSWLLKLWANSYLAFQNNLYIEISPTLEACWGSRASCVWWVQGVLVRRARAALRHLHAQPTAATHALRLLATLAHAHSHRQRLATNEEFLSLVSWEAEGSDLPGHLRKELHRAFAATTSYAQGEVRSRLVNSSIVLQDKFQNIINMQLDTEPVRNLLADTLDCFTGVTQGIRDTHQSEELVQILMKALASVPLVIFRYHNYAGVVLPALKLMTAAARRLLHARPEHAFRFLEICSETFDVYGRWISGKVSNITAETEEEAYEDVCALLELVVVVGRTGAAADVRGACARGLRLALPLVTPPLLAVPRLAHAAYRVLRDLEAAGQITEKTLPIEDFNMVIHALQVGLTAVSCDVSNLCCDTIIGLATKLRGQDTDNPYVISLLTLVELLLMLILKMEIPPDTIPAAGSAIYCLTCVKPEMLQGLAAQLIHSIAINDPANVPRLEQAFGVLTMGVVFDGLRTHRIKFQDNFDKFLTSIHGFLIVK